MYFKEHATTILLIGFAGFVTGWAMTEALILAIGAGCGALIAGAVTARLFGERGMIGVALAGFGAVTATLLGAAIVGFAIMAQSGAALAVAAVAEAITSDTIIAGRWIIVMGVAQWVAVDRQWAMQTNPI